MAFRNYKKTPLISFIILFAALYGLLLDLLEQRGIIVSVSASVVISGILFIYDRYLWKYLPFLTIVRNVSGRYKGSLVSKYNGKSYEVCIEIHQTASMINVNQYTKNETGVTRSSSDIASLQRLDDGRLKLSFSFHNGGDQMRDELDSHLGFCELTFHSSNKSFIGFYFTNREQQTKGTIEATRVKGKLKGDF